MKNIFLIASMLATAVGVVYHMPSDSTMNNYPSVERQEIIDTVTALFVSTDNRNWEDVKERFADQVLLDYTSLAGGDPATLTPEQIVSGWSQVLPGFESTHHALSNFHVHIEGDEASVHHYGRADHYLPNEEGGPLWIVVGTYDLNLQRIDGTWKISHMKFNLKFMDGNTDLPRLAQANIQQ